MVGIISINKYSVHMNYGAALHSYSFQQFLKKNNIDSEIIDYFPRFMDGYNLEYPILTSIHNRAIKSSIRWIIGFYANKKKYNKFQSFFQKHYISTDKKYNEKKLKEASELNLPYRVFICESDVIWKPTTTKGFDDGYFLNFPAAYNKIKISYAASIGNTLMTSEEKKQFKELLVDFNHISLREKEGRDFASQFTSQNVHWVLDPTLLLSKEEYLEIAIKPKEDKYLLVYNCMVNDKNMIKHAQKLSKEMGLKIIEISIYHENKILFNHILRDDIGIEEFLGYFANASFIVCNAFHGTCFSIIFNKDFYLFARDHTDHRMLSIIESANLQDRFIPKDKIVSRLPLDSIDYQKVNKWLEKERKKSIDFILNAIKL